MNELWTGAGIALVLEGLCYALAPNGMRRLASLAALAPPERLRWAGLTGVCLGVAVVWLVRR